MLVSQPALLLGIDDRKFEELVATLLYDLGLENVQLTPPRKDGGKDIIATHVQRAGERATYLIECKHWPSGNKVTMHWAISLLDLCRREGSATGVLLSSSGFGPRLMEQETTLRKEGLHLRDGQDLSRWMRTWERQYGSVLVEPVDPKKVLELAD